MIHVDTNVLVGFVKPDERFQPLRTALREGELLAVSAVAWQEYMCGPFPPGAPQRLLTLLQGRVIPLERESAELAAVLYNATGRRRGKNADCMIAAIAMQANATFFTFNAADFRPFEPYGLRLF
jgi:predicted nucleic acid-binding protein